MEEISLKNKKAWEYRAYEFWDMNYGSPKEKAEEILQNPKARLRYYQKYFEEVGDLNIANMCGSNGRIAVRFMLTVLVSTSTLIQAMMMKRCRLLKECKLTVEQFETEYAVIFAATKEV